MRIAVVITLAPLVFGGAEKMADDLVSALNRYGHQARRYDLIYNGSHLRHFIKGAMSSRTLHFDDVDMVIPLTPINAGIVHPKVVPWLIGQTKAFYEFFDSPLGPKGLGAEGEIIRDIMIKEDTKAMSIPRKVFTISPRTKELFLKYNNVDTEVLILPLEDSENYTCNEYGDFVMYHSRIYPQKRQHLAIEAMKYTKTPVKLLVVGTDNHSKYVKELKDNISDNNLEDKVTFQVGRFSEEEKYNWLSNCLGGFYLGEEEDYWTIVTTEVMMSKKPVIAPIDTGATKYVVKDGITGLQPEGTPQAIAEAMDRLYLDKEAARRMGEAGNKLIREISPSWETVVRTLTEDGR